VIGWALDGRRAVHDSAFQFFKRTQSVARASTQDTAISAIAPPGTEIKRFDDDATALQALISGQVQGLGASNTILAQHAAVISVKRCDAGTPWSSGALALV